MAKWVHDSISNTSKRAYCCLTVLSSTITNNINNYYATVALFPFAISIVTKFNNSIVCSKR